MHKGKAKRVSKRYGLMGLSQARPCSRWVEITSSPNRKNVEATLRRYMHYNPDSRYGWLEFAVIKVETFGTELKTIRLKKAHKITAATLRKVTGYAPQAART